MGKEVYWPYSASARRMIEDIERADLTDYSCNGAEFYTILRDTIKNELSLDIIATDRAAWADAHEIAERLNGIREKLFKMLGVERRRGEQFEPTFAGTLSIAIDSFVNAVKNTPEPLQQPTPQPQPFTPDSRLTTDEVRATFAIFEECGYMRAQDDGHCEWLGTKSLFSYWEEQVANAYNIRESNGRISRKPFEDLFNIHGTARLAVRNPLPKGHREIDKILQTQTDIYQ